MSDKVLRLGVFEGSALILERQLPLKNGVKLTRTAQRGINVATTGEAGETNWSVRLVAPDPQLKRKGAPPPPVDTFGEVLVNASGQFVLRFADGLEGWVGASGEGGLPFADQIRQGLATKAGNVWEITLSGESQGKLIAGTASVLFKLVQGPIPEGPKGTPEGIRKVAALLGGIDLDDRISALGHSEGLQREQMAARIAISIANLTDQCHRLEPVGNPENTLPPQLVTLADKLQKATGLPATPAFSQLAQSAQAQLEYKPLLAIGPFLVLRADLFPAKLSVCLWTSNDWLSMQTRVERINPASNLAASLAPVSSMRCARLNVLEIGGAGEGVSDLVASASLPMSGISTELVVFALREVEGLRNPSQD